MRLSHQIFAISFIVSALALSLVGAHTVEQVAKILNRQTLESMEARAYRDAHAFEGVIKSMHSDLALLSASEAVQRLPSTWVPYARSTMEASVRGLFQSLMRERPYYAQLRLLGPDGSELVRINREDGSLFVVPNEQLQNKQHRPYFQRCLDMGPGQVYISRLDLNQEQGKIVEPYQPVLRAAIPVIESNRALLGVLVINLDISSLMSEFSNLEGSEELLLLNTNGDYLVQRDQSRTFGFEFGEDWNLATEHDLGERWTNWSTSGNPSEAKEITLGSHLLALHKISLSGGTDYAEEPNLVIGVRESLERFAAQREGMQQHFWATMSIICVIIALMLAAVTHKITRPLKVLAETTHRITDGDHHERAPEDGALEIQRLAKDLNIMLEAMQRAAKDQQMATLGRMAAMVAHDLRNGLTSIKVNLQVMARDDDLSDSMREDRMDIALEQVLLMEKVLQEILVFARAESLQTSMEELAGILRATLITVMPVADERDITITTSGLETLPRLSCDRTKLIQVFRNLIDNALAASPDGGHVQVIGNLKSTDDGMTVEIRIVDQGDGIDDGVKDTLFDPFVTTRARGTGLGLAIVKRVTELHDGVVTLQNGEVGAIATVTLPVKTEPEADQLSSQNHPALSDAAE